jgi:outer membrane protein assembly factor BamB
MILAEWEGYLLVFIGSDVYLADSRAQVTNENHYEYEWFHWKLGKVVTCATVHDGKLYIGTEDGNIYSFDGDPAEGDEYPGYKPDGEAWEDHMYIDSYWTTPVDRFGAPNKLKTTNKKGCVVEGSGDMDVYVKVEDTDFEYIGTYKDITDYFASRIKRKKWKDIQLKFQSNTKFSLETATLEAFIGGYIKR